MKPVTLTEPAPDVWIDPTHPHGYRRSPPAQAAFDAAVHVLRGHDGRVHGEHDDPRLRADLVLEGGGVKGIGLVGAILALAEAGYAFPRVAGTSAGAIVGAFVAAAQHAGAPLGELRGHLDNLHLTQFTPIAPLHKWLDDSSRITHAIADAGLLAHRPGLHSGQELEDWLRTTLQESYGVRTFADLRITADDDPGGSLPPAHRYRLLVHTADITRGQLVRLPWDYHYYGLDPDEAMVASAVRASMSIPLYFEPVTVQTYATKVPVPAPDGTLVMQQFSAGSVTWVDGGLLQNFPIRAFDRADGEVGRWPTIGIRLSLQPSAFGATQACQSAIDVAIRCMHTAVNEWDFFHVEQATAAHTIYVDNAGVSATQFDISEAERHELFLNGVRAATRFITDAAASGGLLPQTTVVSGDRPQDDVQLDLVQRDEEPRVPRQVAEADGNRTHQRQ